MPKINGYSVVWYTGPRPVVSKYVTFIVAGREICPKTKKIHWQGYVETNKRIRFKVLKEILGRTAHIEKARKCALANIKYCLKDGDIALVVGNASDPKASAFLSSLIQKSRKLKTYLTKLRTKQDASKVPKKVIEAQAFIQGEAIPKIKKEALFKKEKICWIQRQPKELSEETRG